MKNSYKYLISILFGVILLVPTALFIIRPVNQNIEKEENRATTNCPKFDFKHLDTFPKAFDQFFDDSFSLRPIGVKLYNRFNYFFLKKSSDETKAILGKDNWIFLGKDLDFYRGSKQLTKAEVKAFEAEFKKRKEFLDSHNCKFLIVFIPTKKEIYQEYISDEYYRYSNKTCTDQTIKILKELNIDYIDLRPEFMEAKKLYPELYHRYDHHWNDYGALVAYQEIVNYTNKTWKTPQPHTVNDFQEEIKETQAGSLAKMLGVADKISFYRYYLNPNFSYNSVKLGQKYKSPDRFPYKWAYENRFENADSTLPRFMMVNDSFGEYLFKNLSEHFSYSLFLFDNWEYNLHAKKVAEDKPDLFMICAYESFLPQILDNLTREENNTALK